MTELADLWGIYEWVSLRRGSWDSAKKTGVYRVKACGPWVTLSALTWVCLADQVRYVQDRPGASQLPRSLVDGVLLQPFPKFRERYICFDYYQRQNWFGDPTSNLHVLILFSQIAIRNERYSLYCYNVQHEVFILSILTYMWELTKWSISNYRNDNFSTSSESDARLKCRLIDMDIFTTVQFGWESPG